MLRRDFLAETVLVIGMAVMTILGSVIAGLNQDGRPVDWTACALLAGACLILPLRRRRPVVTLLVTLSSLVVYHALAFPYGSAVVPALIATYSVIAETGSRLRPVGLIAAAFLVLYPAAGLPLGVYDSDYAAGTVLVWAVVVGGVVVLAELTRMRREQLAMVKRQMEEAERLQEEEARRRTDEERMRIAREIHDIASHTISVIAIQSSVAKEALRDCAACPDSARTALDIIRDASKEAMNEMQAAIGVLRATAGESEPMPGLAQVERLMTSAEEAGLEVLRTVRGTARPLPPVVDLTAYRIIQESLTNTLRHAAARSAEVDLAYDERGLTLRVSDDGRGPTGGTGYGLVSMRERASTVDGWADAGPRAGGGFEVRAWLPAPLEDSGWRGSA